MTMSQVVSDDQQAGPMTNGCDGGDLVIEPMDLSATPMSNGSMTPTKLYPCDDLSEGQLSPASARRRSTRASALKAQEKIKLKEEQPQPKDSNSSELNGQELEECCASKKRRLMSGTCLDQYSHTFYIKEGDDGEVCEVSDESEISSLHSEEIAFLKSGYEKLLNKELTSEDQGLRYEMVKRCEAELRREEARLILMKKINSSQMIAAQKAVEAKRMTPNIALSGAGGAYEPTMAVPRTASSNSNAKHTANNVKNNPLLALAGLTSSQQQEFLAKASSSNPQLAAQLLQLMARTPGATNQAQLASLVTALQQQQSQKEQVSKEAKESSQSSHQTAAKAYAALTPQQRAANARNAFRQQADKQLTQIPPPKSQPTNLSFIPNPNQPDFCYLVGLDLTVQRMLKDKTANASVKELPYRCEECHTDFTPSWKAIGTPDDLHLYCEQCVHSTQMKKIQKDHVTFLRKAFNKVNAQEKEFEKQIADGKLDAVMAAAAAQAAQTSQGASTSQSQPQNLSTKQNGYSTPSAKTSTPTPISSSKVASASNGPQSGKTKSTNNLNMMQQQMAMMQQFMRSNPMMAAMMSGGSQSGNSSNAAAMANMMQMYNPMMMQMFAAAQQAQSRTQQQSQQPNVAAMALLAQAAMQSAQAQGSGNSTSSAAQMAQLAAMNPASLMGNPQLMRQLQDRLAEQYKRNGKK